MSSSRIDPFIEGPLSQVTVFYLRSFVWYRYSYCFLLVSTCRMSFHPLTLSLCSQSQSESFVGSIQLDLVFLNSSSHSLPFDQKFNLHIFRVIMDMSELTGLPQWISRKEFICNAGDLGVTPGKIPWRRKQQPTPIFLAEKFHGQKSLKSKGSQRVRHD